MFGRYARVGRFYKSLPKQNPPTAFVDRTGLADRLEALGNYFMDASSDRLAKNHFSPATELWEFKLGGDLKEAAELLRVPFYAEDGRFG